ncbi:MAG: 3-isopropylmalate dehydratase large subunit, partial [Synergistetes bacterium]|nr:3-isopropylmalate dehydratase large subunit [Synergistota bacterium]
VNFNGKLPEWVSAKDLILYLIGKIGIDGALYRALEFGGSTIDAMGMDGRFTICNMAIEAGAKAGIIPPDETTLGYVESRAKRGYEPLLPDKDANYEQVIEIDVSDIAPQVALPHLPSNAKAVKDVGKIRIDQVVIGSCTNGRDTDMEVTHRILKGKKVAPWVRLIVIPATQKVYLNMLEKGWVKDLIEVGAVVSTPTCGPCLGGHMGVLAKGEKAVSTTNRNFVGRMGHPESEVYLSSPAVAAASAITGYITDPLEVV